MFVFSPQSSQNGIYIYTDPFCIVHQLWSSKVHGASVNGYAAFCIGGGLHHVPELPMHVTRSEFKQHWWTEQNFLFSSRRLIENNAFLSLTNLEELNLSNNFMDSIDSKTFQNLEKLEALDLSCNHVRVLGDQSFQGLPSLLTLSRTGNALESVHGFGNLKTWVRTELHLGLVYPTFLKISRPLTWNSTDKLQTP